MNAFNHRKAILALSGIASLIAFAVILQLAADTIGGARGLLAGVVLAVVVFGGCGLVHSMRQPGVLRLTRPAPVVLPEPAGDLPEPAGHLS